MGERFRKATPKELRWYSGAFAFIPVWGALFVYVGHSFLERADAVGIWGYAMVFLLGGALWLAAWAKYIPASVSWLVGAAIWLVTLWLAFSGRII